MTSDTQRAALSPEEWKRFGFEHGPLSAERFRDLFIGRPRGNIGVKLNAGMWVSETPKDCHALAALCLYEQPFGFSQADVDLLEKAAARHEAEAKRPSRDDMDDFNRPNRDEIRSVAARYASLALRIANLLPPRP